MNENIGRLKSPYVFLIRSSFFQLMIEFKQPITIKTIVKPNVNGGTILRVVGVKNKHIPYSLIRSVLYI